MSMPISRNSPDAYGSTPVEAQHPAPITDVRTNSRPVTTSSSVAAGGPSDPSRTHASDAVQDCQTHAAGSPPARDAFGQAEKDWGRYDSDLNDYQFTREEYDLKKAAWDKYQADLAAWRTHNAEVSHTNAGAEAKIASLTAEQALLSAARSILGIGGSLMLDGQITAQELGGIVRGEFGLGHSCHDESQVAAMKAAAQALLDNPELMARLFKDGAMSYASVSTEGAAIIGEIAKEKEKLVPREPEPTPPPNGDPGLPPRPPKMPTSKRPESMGPMPTIARAGAAAATGSTQATSSSSSSSSTASTLPANTAAGWSGIVDKLQGAMGDINDKLDRLGALEVKEARGETLSEDEKKELKALKAEEPHLTRRLTDMANRMKMYTELLSNMSKLYSDLSMSIIRKIS